MDPAADVRAAASGAVSRAIFAQEWRTSAIHAGRQKGDVFSHRVVHITGRRAGKGRRPFFDRKLSVPGPASRRPFPTAGPGCFGRDWAQLAAMGNQRVTERHRQPFTYAGRLKGHAGVTGREGPELVADA